MKLSLLEKLLKEKQEIQDFQDLEVTKEKRDSKVFPDLEVQKGLMVLREPLEIKESLDFRVILGKKVILLE